MSPAARGPLDEAQHPLDVVRVDHRRDGRRRIAAVSEHVGVDVVLEEGHEVVTHRRLDEQAGASEADLSGVVVLPRRLAGGGVEIGIGEHDERPLTAELGRERHDVLGRRTADVPGRLG